MFSSIIILYINRKSDKHFKNEEFVNLEMQSPLAGKSISKQQYGPIKSFSKVTNVFTDYIRKNKAKSIGNWPNSLAILSKLAINLIYNYPATFVKANNN